MALLASTSAALIDAPASRAATALDEIHLSADIHTRFPADGGAVLVVGDDDIILYDTALGEAEATAFLGAIDRSDVDAYHAADACGGALFSLSATAEIGGTLLRPVDVFGTTGVKFLDGIAEGIADGVDLDAVTRDPGTCDLVVSFDVTVLLDGQVFRPDDLVRFSGGAFSLFRAGPGSGNLDAAHVLDTGAVLASFAAPVPDLGTAFADQDVVEQASPGSPWEVAFQPAAIDTSWAGADTDALYVVRAPIPGDLRWSRADIDVLEGQGSVDLVIDRVGPNEGPVSVSWTTVDGTATSGIDFGGASGSAAFSDGQASGTVPITLFDDGVVDGDKTFFVDLVQASNGAQVIHPSRITVRIRDDEDFLFADGFES
ncbi:Calx-beta domain-containing protein [Halomonas denitrificans]|nr:hypothetical protein [Halomonas denitrificans]